MAAGDGVRDADARRNELRARSKRRQKDLLRAEQREIEAGREMQEQLRRDFYSRNPSLRVAA